MPLSLALTVLLGASDAQTAFSAAQALEQAGEEQKARAAFEALIHASPAWVLPRLEAGRLWLRASEGLGPAELHLDAARSLSPENPRAHYLWALLQDDLGRGDLSLSSLDVALTLRADFPEARLRRAALRLSRGDAAGAVEDYSAALAVDPAPTGPRLQLAVALELSGRVSEAEGVLQALARTEGVKPLARKRLLELFERTGQVSKARALRLSVEGERKKMRELKKSSR